MKNLTLTSHRVHRQQAAQEASIHSLLSIIQHPRSLARPQGTWRPPLLTLPALSGFSAPTTLTAAITRYRVGPLVKARVRGYGETREPCYLITVRMTEPTGQTPDPLIAERWIRGLIAPADIHAVHAVNHGSAITFIWLVDANYCPVMSPQSLFTDFSAAA